MAEITRGPDGEPVAVIYHNPKCSTSRNTLALIRAAGIEPQVVEYLKAPPGRTRLVELMRKAGIGPRELVRSKEKLFSELGLGKPDISDKALTDAMVEHPILMNRPVVATAKGVRLCRPADRVGEIL